MAIASLVKLLKARSQKYSALFLIMSGACSYDSLNSLHTVCGCRGADVNFLSKQLGVVANTADGYKIISLKYGYLVTCDSIPSDIHSDGAAIAIYGELIPLCALLSADYGISYNRLDLSAYFAVDTSRLVQSVQVKILKTQDYGMPPGFGYSIYYAAKNFRIQQLTIPASSAGSKPFQSYTDALKVAFLVGYRIENFDGFPAVELSDLHYLRIAGI